MRFSSIKANTMKFQYIFYSEVQHVQSLGFSRGRGLYAHRWVNPRLKQVRIIVIGKAPSWESVPQSSDTQE